MIISVEYIFMIENNKSAVSEVEDMSNNIAMWHEKSATFKENRAVVKLHDENGDFVKSVIIPTVYYPLNGNYEVFHYKNTEQVHDEAVLKVFDRIKYSIGRCYTNTKALVAALRKEGIDVKSYVGWLFVDETIPVHHCWAVLNGNSILDLSDDLTQKFSSENRKNFENVKNSDELRKVLASFHVAAMKWKNSERCFPVGKVSSTLLYVGCECDPDDGRIIYQRLKKQFPDHECDRNCDSSGLNETQKFFRDAGLM